ncbi:MAG: hypothetical protein B9S38_02305 [Verrucomicrobiia bacterium Tous-C4TDCM]|nr:MAG: hypothetical protein B9S38_02305 [Verrucomicrobiae bacterium Tous-C4TDCM]
MLPKIYRTNHPTAPWLVVYSDPTDHDRHGKVKRIRRWFAQEAEARAHHTSLVRAAANVGTAGLNMDAKARADYFSSRHLLDAAGLQTASLTDVVRAHLATAPVPSNVTLRVDALLAQFIETKRNDENAAPRTVRNLWYRLDSWREREDLRTVGDISQETLLRLRSRPGVSAQSRINDMAAASSFLSWLVEREIVPTNPLLKLRRPRTDVRQPKVLRPPQVRALLEAALALGEGRLVRYLALQLLAGLRPSEAAELRPEQVTTEGTVTLVRVLRGKKRGKIRSTTTLPNFRAWWEAAPWPARTKEPEGTHVRLWDELRDRRLFDAIREQAGLHEWTTDPGTGERRRTASLWQSDICRHTWISVRIQQTRNEALVAFEAGNSPEIIHGHYLALISSEEVRQIEAIRPQRLTRRKPAPTTKP